MKKKPERQPSGDIDYRVRCVMVADSADGTMLYQVVRYGVTAEECGHSPWADVDDKFDHSAGRGKRRNFDVVASVPQREYFFTPGLGRHDEIALEKVRRGSIRR